MTNALVGDMVWHAYFGMLPHPRLAFLARGRLYPCPCPPLPHPSQRLIGLSLPFAHACARARSRRLRLECGTPPNGSPTDQTPMFIDPTRERNLFSHLCASRAGQKDLGQVRFHAHHSTTGRSGSDVDHQHFVLGQFLDLCGKWAGEQDSVRIRKNENNSGQSEASESMRGVQTRNSLKEGVTHLGLFLVIRLDTEQTTQQEVVDFQFRVNSRQLTDRSQHLADQTIRTAECGINLGSHTNQPTGYGELQVVVLRKERGDTRVDRTAVDLALVVFCDDTRSHLDFLTQLQHTRKDRATRNTTLEVVNFSTGLVDIERTDNDQTRGCGEIADGDRNALVNVFIDGVDVVFELGRDRNDRRTVRNRACSAEKRGGKTFRAGG